MASIAEKIAKLLRLAESGDQHEAALAAARAQELMLKYAVSQEEVRRAGGTVEAEPIEVGGAFATYPGGRAPQWHKELAVSLQRAFMVQTFWNTLRIWAVGARSNRESFVATWAYLRDQIQRLANEGWAALPADRRAYRDAQRWKKGFCFGACHTIAVRLLDAERKLEATSTSAIVLRDRNKDVDDFVKANVPHHEVAFKAPATGYREGQQAGWAINVDKRAGASRGLPGAGSR